ncbi:hypothetical protein PBY51_011144 [Eleginops maclovinus]|uniref:Ig-like domain-containing protein n=1 Tax=Eleginops maclovinus TaxID=56733 RepID=A0AAN7XE16_ELEMC|nr:hypothetical protein PBY51_011144 [Eleginops maclovinus]
MKGLLRLVLLHPPDLVLSSLKIQQSPVNLLIKPGQEEARLECFHGDNNFPYMLWYRHSSAGGQPGDMDLIGLLHYENADVEKAFAERFNITGHSKGRAQLTISNMKPADRAEYFCAARSTVLHLLRLLYKKLQALSHKHLHHKLILKTRGVSQLLEVSIPALRGKTKPCGAKNILHIIISIMSKTQLF